MSFDRSSYTAHDVPDLFNALPVLFGFRPAESVVAIATNGPTQRFGFRLRLDLPEPAHVDLAARTVVHHLRAQGAEGAVVLALTEQQRVARDLLAAIEAGLGTIEPVTVARSDGDRYWIDVPGFPESGITYETSDHHVSIVQAVAAGQQILPDRESLEARFAPVSGSARNEMALKCAEELESVLAAMDQHPSAIGEAALWALRPTIRHIEASEPLTDTEVARLCVWMASVDARNAVWDLIVPDTAQPWLEALTRASQLVVSPYEPAVLSLASFAAWACGDGTQALIAAERAHASAPAYSMAELMLEILEAGMSPAEWADQVRMRSAG